MSTSGLTLPTRTEAEARAESREAAYAASALLYAAPVFAHDDADAELARDFFHRACPAGSVVQTPDGEEWTVVYHNLDGYGVIAGSHDSLAGARDEDLPPHTHLLRTPSPVHNCPCLGELVRVLWRAPK